VNQPAAFRFRRIRPGRHHGYSTTHAYLIQLKDSGWSLSIGCTIVVAGVQVSDPHARRSQSWHESPAVASAFEQFGDDYQPHEHSHC